MTAIYNNPKSLLLACFALLLFQTVSYGQYSEGDNDDVYNGRKYLGEIDVAHLFSCKDFFKDTADKQNMHFKRIVINDYSAHDSTLANKRLTGKRIWLFNGHGRETMFIRYDSTGKCMDSVLFSYDKNNRLSQSSTYWRNDSGIIKKTGSFIQVRNEQGLVIKDSSWELNKNISYLETKPFSISCMYMKYDDRGNCIYSLTIHNGDTTMFFTQQYDNKNRVIAAQRKFEYQWANNYKKYDDSSNVIEETFSDKDDTVHTLSTYDNENRMLTSMEYDGGKLKDKTTYMYNDDGSYTENEEKHKTGVGLISCDVVETTVTMTDHYGNEISKTIKRAQGNDTVTETDINKYTYTFGGKIISDTEIYTEADGIWSSSTSIKIHDNKYDARENLLEELALGCELEMGEKKMTYTYNDKKQVLQVSHYSLCDDASPYSTDEYTYYPDGVTLKQEKIGGGHFYMEYGEDTRVLNVTQAGAGFAEQAVIEYQ